MATEKERRTQNDRGEAKTEVKTAAKTDAET
jgi:hypothetical protein